VSFDTFSFFTFFYFSFFVNQFIIWIENGAVAAENSEEVCAELIEKRNIKDLNFDSV